jgi:hypothetical protein
VERLLRKGHIHTNMDLLLVLPKDKLVLLMGN